MNDSYGKRPHTVHDIQYHFVWVTKYRYSILTRDIALRMRDLIRQTCEARNITILTGHVSKDHVHLHVSSPPGLAPSKIAQYIKGRSSRLIQQEFHHRLRIHQQYDPQWTEHGLNWRRDQVGVRHGWRTHRHEVSILPQHGTLRRRSYLGGRELSPCQRMCVFGKLQ